MGNVVRAPLDSAESMHRRASVLFVVDGPEGPVALSALDFFGAMFRPSSVVGELPHPEIKINPYIPEVTPTAEQPLH